MRRIVLFASLALVVGAAGFAGAIVVAERNDNGAFAGDLPPAARARVADDVERLAADLDDWWDERLLPYRSGLPDARLTDGTDRLRCDGERVRVDEDLVENAWAGVCTEGLTVAYDAELFATSTVTLELTMAHEYGHLAQFMVPDLDAGLQPGGLPIDSELQADCFMGAWWGDQRPDAPLEDAVREVATTGDLPFTPRDDPDAHGTDRERVDAFRRGVDGGFQDCVPKQRPGG